jgi:hypothetical protein
MRVLAGGIERLACGPSVQNIGRIDDAPTDAMKRGAATVNPQLFESAHADGQLGRGFIRRKIDCVSHGAPTVLIGSRGLYAVRMENIE